MSSVWKSATSPIVYCVRSAVLAVALSASASSGALFKDPSEWELWLPIPGDTSTMAQSISITGEKIQHSPVELWTRRALDLIVKYERNPVRTSRSLTYMHVAMHDAVALSARYGATELYSEVSAHIAAANALAYLFPLEPESAFEEALINDLAAAFPDHWPQLLASDSMPTKVAKEVLASLRGRAMHDGAERVWPISLRPNPVRGMFEGTPPIYAFNPLEPWAGTWLTWTVGVDQLQVLPPLQYDSPEFQLELNEVVAVARTLTPEQKQIAEQWHLGPGSVTPAGIWNLHFLEYIEENSLTAIEGIRLGALLNVAMMDAFVACWSVKYNWWTLRPITAAIYAGMHDFQPALHTPQHPSYVSGHAAVSGAAATVMSASFPHDALRLGALADEAARSRLYGGIHYPHDNEQGLFLGRQVGHAVLQSIDARW